MNKRLIERRNRGELAIRPAAISAPLLRARWALLPAALMPFAVLANPVGGSVVAGQASISTAPGLTTIQQQSAAAVINWQQFGIGSGETVQFLQPSASAAVLNRVIGGNPSEILGNLTANGRVFLINPQGVMFGAGAQVDVGSLTASTLELSDDDFLAGRYVLAGNSDAAVANNGAITARDGGFVVLAGHTVSNGGLIQTRLGDVVLASGAGLTLDLNDTGLVSYRIDAAALGTAAGVANTGSLMADGGRVFMAARVAQDLVATAVNNSGVIRARSLVEHDGEILLSAEGGDIAHSGVLDASAMAVDVGGGRIELVTDRDIGLATGSQTLATGIGTGGGGSVRAVAADHLDYAEGAHIDVRSGSPLAAEGGFAELSGHRSVTLADIVTVGSNGTFRLDPLGLTIGGNINGVNLIAEAVFERQVQAGGTNQFITSGGDLVLLDSLANGGDGSYDGRNGGLGGSVLLCVGDASGACLPNTETGGVRFDNLADALLTDGAIRIDVSGTGRIAIGDATTGSNFTALGSEIRVGNVSANGNLLLSGQFSGPDQLTGLLTATGPAANVVAGELSGYQVTLGRFVDGPDAPDLSSFTTRNVQTGNINATVFASLRALDNLSTGSITVPGDPGVTDPTDPRFIPYTLIRGSGTVTINGDIQTGTLDIGPRLDGFTDPVTGAGVQQRVGTPLASLAINGNVNASRDVIIGFADEVGSQAITDIQLNGGVVRAGGLLGLMASGNIAGQSLLLDAAGDITTTALSSSSGDLNIFSRSGNVTVGDLTTRGPSSPFSNLALANIDISAARNLAAGNISNEARLTLNAGSTDAGGNITVGDLSVGSITGGGTAIDRIELFATGLLRIADSNQTGDSLSANSIALRAGSNRLDLNGNTLLALDARLLDLSTVGDIIVEAAGDVTLGDLRTAGGTEASSGVDVTSTAGSVLLGNIETRTADATGPGAVGFADGTAVIDAFGDLTTGQITTRARTSAPSFNPDIGVGSENALAVIGLRSHGGNISAGNLSTQAFAGDPSRAAAIQGGANAFAQVLIENTESTRGPVSIITGGISTDASAFDDGSLNFATQGAAPFAVSAIDIVTEADAQNTGTQAFGAQGSQVQINGPVRSRFASNSANPGLESGSLRVWVLGGGIKVDGGIDTEGEVTLVTRPSNDGSGNIAPVAAGEIHIGAVTTIAGESGPYLVTIESGSNLMLSSIDAGKLSVYANGQIFARDPSQGIVLSTSGLGLNGPLAIQAYTYDQNGQFVAENINGGNLISLHSSGEVISSGTLISDSLDIASGTELNLSFSDFITTNLLASGTSIIAGELDVAGSIDLTATSGSIDITTFFSAPLQMRLQASDGFGGNLSPSLAAIDLSGTLLSLVSGSSNPLVLGDLNPFSLDLQTSSTAVTLGNISTNPGSGGLSLNGPGSFTAGTLASGGTLQVETGRLVATALSSANGSVQGNVSGLFTGSVMGNLGVMLTSSGALNSLDASTVRSSQGAVVLNSAGGARLADVSGTSVSLVAAGTISSTGNLVVTSSSGNLTVQAAAVNAANLSLSSAADLVLAGTPSLSTAAGGVATLSAASGVVRLNNIAAGSIKATGPSIDAGGAVNVSGFLDLLATNGSLTTGDINAGGNATLRANAGNVLAGRISASSVAINTGSVGSITATDINATAGNILVDAQSNSSIPGANVSLGNLVALSGGVSVDSGAAGSSTIITSINARDGVGVDDCAGNCDQHTLTRIGSVVSGGAVSIGTGFAGHSVEIGSVTTSSALASQLSGGNRLSVATLVGGPAAFTLSSANTIAINSATAGLLSLSGSALQTASGNAITLTTTVGDLSLSLPSVTAQTIRFDSAAAIKTVGGISYNSGNGSVALLARVGNVDFGGITSGDVMVVAPTVVSSASGNISGALDLTSTSGGISFDPTTTQIGATAVRLRSAGGITGNPLLTLNAVQSVDIMAAGNIALGAVDVSAAAVNGSNTSLVAGGSLSVGRVSTAGAAVLSAGGAIATDQVSGGSVSLTSALGVSSLGSGSDLALSSSVGDVSVQAPSLTSSAGSVRVNSAAGITLGNVLAARNVSLNAAGLGNISANDVTGGRGTADTLQVSSQSGALTLRNVSGGAVTVRTGQNLAQSAAQGPLLVSGLIDAGREVLVQSGGSLITVNGISSSSGAITVAGFDPSAFGGAGNTAISATGRYSASGNIGFSTFAGAISLSGANVGSGSGLVSVDSAGNPSGNLANAGAINLANSQLQSAAGQSIHLGGGSITATGSQLRGGNIELLAGSQVLLDNSSITGNLSFFSADVIRAQQAVSLNVDAVSATGRVVDLAGANIVVGTGAAPMASDFGLLAELATLSPPLLPGSTAPNASFNASESLALGQVSGTARYVVLRAPVASIPAIGGISGASDLFLHYVPADNSASFTFTLASLAFANQAATFAFGSSAYLGGITITDPASQQPVVKVLTPSSNNTNYIFLTDGLTSGAAALDNATTGRVVVLGPQPPPPPAPTPTDQLSDQNAVLLADQLVLEDNTLASDPQPSQTQSESGLFNSGDALVTRDSSTQVPQQCNAI